MVLCTFRNVNNRGFLQIFKCSAPFISCKKDVNNVKFKYIFKNICEKILDE